MEARKIKALERRTVKGDVEIRNHDGKQVIEGYAAVFNKRSGNLGGFVEVIKPGAFTKTIQEADVRALFNHDENLVLGRSRAGTLELSEDASGLYYRITPPDTTYARDLMVVMERGDVNQSSFAFYAHEQDWGTTEDDFPERSVRQAGLVDVSPVTYPAYQDATSKVGRSALMYLATRAKPEDADAVLDGDLDAIKRTLNPPEETEETQETPEELERRAETQRRIAEAKIKLLELNTRDFHLE